jgi:hypothetical protein
MLLVVADEVARRDAAAVTLRAPRLNPLSGDDTQAVEHDRLGHLRRLAGWAHSSVARSASGSAAARSDAERGAQRTARGAP